MDADSIARATRPEQVFYGIKTAEELASAYRKIMKSVHPDVSSHPMAAAASATLQGLYEKARKAVADGTWTGEDRTWVFKTRRGHVYSRYLTKRESEHPGLVEVTTASGAGFEVPPDWKKRADRSAKLVSSLHEFLDDKEVDKTVRGYLPSGLKVFDGASSVLVSARRSPGGVCVADVLRAENSLTPKTAAWVMSSLMDACCFLAYTRTVHGALTANNVFLIPGLHTVQVVGGWWYATEIGAKMDRVPAEVYGAAPKNFSDKRSKTVMDLESVKALGRRVLVGRTDTPGPMQKWLMMPARPVATEEYSAWVKARDLSFERKFHPAEFTADGIHDALNKE